MCDGSAGTELGLGADFTSDCDTVTDGTDAGCGDVAAFCVVLVAEAALVVVTAAAVVDAAVLNACFSCSTIFAEGAGAERGASGGGV